jgi:hypothetical protein
MVGLFMIIRWIFPQKLQRGTSFWEYPFTTMIFGLKLKAMSTTEFNSLSEKIEVGVQLAVKRLKEKVRKDGGNLVFSKNKKIIRIQAKDLK